jgi:hypothetical protein
MNLVLNNLGVRRECEASQIDRREPEHVSSHLRTAVGFVHSRVDSSLTPDL